MTGNIRVGINRSCNDALQSRLNQRLGARRSASRVVARLQSDVSRAAFEPFARMLPGDAQGDGFGMVEQIIFVPALASHLSIELTEPVDEEKYYILMRN